MGLDGTILELENNRWIKSNIYNPDKQYWMNIYNRNKVKILRRNNRNIVYKYLDVEQEIVLDCETFFKTFCEIERDDLTGRGNPVVT